MRLLPASNSKTAARLRPFLILLSGTFLAAPAMVVGEDLVNAAVVNAMNGGNSTYTLDSAYSLTWTSAAVYLGNNTSNNTLTIKNDADAVVTGTRGHIYFGNTLDATANVALITGAGSTLTTAATFYMGYAGSRNELNITEGGAVSANANVIGYGNAANAGLGNFNTVTVTGPGSQWSSTTYSYVGYLGSNNSVLLSEGGQFSGERGLIGFGDGNNTSLGGSNSVVVTGENSHWSASGLMYVGYYGSGNSFTLSDKATASTFRIQVGLGNLSNQANGNSNETLLTGAGTKWETQDGVWVGNYGSGNRLVVQNGAQLVNASQTTIGEGYYDRPLLGGSNQATVTGSGSRWSNATFMEVGQYGSNNRLDIKDGGVVTNEEGFIGRHISSQNNTVKVTGAGSIWKSTGTVQVGFDNGTAHNTGNLLVVSDSGLVQVGDAALESLLFAPENFLQLDGGYVALYGDQVSYLESILAQGTIKVWSDTDWVAASLADLDFAYFADGVDASAFTGGVYSDLGGYTVLTSVVPEPSICGLLGLALGFGVLRRRRP